MSNPTDYRDDYPRGHQPSTTVDEGPRQRTRTERWMEEDPSQLQQKGSSSTPTKDQPPG